MDMSLNVSGDFDTDILGRPYEIDGTEEILQKVYISLSAHGECFIYDRDLGGQLYKTDISSENAEKMLYARAKDLTENITGAEICGIEIRNGDTYAVVCIEGKNYDVALRRG